MKNILILAALVLFISGCGLKKPLELPKNPTNEENTIPAYD